MPTGSPLIARTHFASHWLSCGQTRPQIAGRLFVSRITSYAFSNSPSLTSPMNFGICTLTGQPSTHGWCLQFRQREASSTAISAE